MPQNIGKKGLTQTRKARIVYEREEMDRSAKKVVDELIDVLRSQRKLKRREEALRTALDIMGIRVPDELGYMGSREEQYAEKLPFKARSLPDACMMVLEDHRDISMDKNQVEYLLTLGGYPFGAKDPTNSVEINLRKLAVDLRCDVTRGAGSNPHRYRAMRLVRKA
jgi:hypothetical protein